MGVSPVSRTLHARTPRPLVLLVAPHFHARHADGSAKIRIDTLEPIETTLGRRQLRLVLAWAELHQEELLENRRLARAGETLQEIDPLQ